MVSAMVTAPFDYLEAHSFPEAVALLGQHGDESKILAGGQSLVPMMNLRLAQPEVLVDVGPIALRPPEPVNGVVRIHALTRHRDLVTHPVVREHCPLLAEATAFVGNPRVRNRGTIGGSLAHAEPTSEIGCTTLALGGQLVVLGPDGERTVDADDFFVGYLTTSLSPEEVVTEVRMPAMRTSSGWSFVEIARRTSDFAVVAVATYVEVDAASSAVTEVRVGLAGVGSRVALARPELVSGLCGRSPSDGDLADMSDAIVDETEPGSDVHASAAYRKHVTRVLLRRGLAQSLARARGAKR